MKSSPTKAKFWDRVKDWCDGRSGPKTMAYDFKPRKPTVEPSEPWPRGPINTTEPGRPIPLGIKLPGKPFFVGTAADLGIGDELTQLEALQQEVEKLLAANEDLRTQLSAAKSNERKLAWRIEAFRKKWPAIHKDFFTAKGKNNEL